MKKILTASAAILCCAMTMMAEPVSPETARQSAAKFLNKKGIALKSEAMRAKNRAMGRADGGEQTEASPYYVFNASQGFVVVSGDDCVGDNLVLSVLIWVAVSSSHHFILSGMASASKLPCEV